jgi:hypothetical protein
MAKPSFLEIRKSAATLGDAVSKLRESLLREAEWPHLAAELAEIFQGAVETKLALREAAAEAALRGAETVEVPEQTLDLSRELARFGAEISPAELRAVAERTSEARGGIVLSDIGSEIARALAGARENLRVELAAPRTSEVEALDVSPGGDLAAAAARAASLAAQLEETIRETEERIAEAGLPDPPEALGDIYSALSRLAAGAEAASLAVAAVPSEERARLIASLEEAVAPVVEVHLVVPLSERRDRAVDAARRAREVFETLQFAPGGGGRLTGKPGLPAPGPGEPVLPGARPGPRRPPKGGKGRGARRRS